MRFRQRKRDGEVELNVTAFLNLMVVLIPFLLLNAVFAHITALELTLPDEDVAEEDQEDEDDDDEESIALEVIIYSDRYVVLDRHTGPLRTFENVNGEHDRQGLHEFLLEIKEEFPDETAITLLAEEDTPYQLLIHTMDSVRQKRVMVNNIEVSRHLFPDVGIGSAPPDPERENGEDAG